MKQNKCIECGDSCNYRAIRCRKCSNKIVPPHKNKFHTKETKNKISNSLKGHIPWNKGKGVSKSPKVIMTKEQLSMFRSNRMKGENNPVKIKEVREKISQSILTLYKLHPEILENRKPSGINQYSQYYTSIEKKIANILNDLKISFIHNYKIGKYFVDFLIYDDIVVECDGKYWHRDKIKDYERDCYLRNKNYYIFRLDENRINDNAFSCVKVIFEILRELGHKKAAGFQTKELPFKKI